MPLVVRFAFSALCLFNSAAGAEVLPWYSGACRGRGGARVQPSEAFRAGGSVVNRSGRILLHGCGLMGMGWCALRLAISFSWLHLLARHHETVTIRTKPVGLWRRDHVLKMASSGILESPLVLFLCSYFRSRGLYP